METTNQNNENELHDERLELTSESVYFLKKITTWTKFFSILGFIMSAVLIVLGVFSKIFFFALNESTSMPISTFLGFVYIVLGIVYVFPALYLYGFTDKTNKAIRDTDSSLITLALKNLKSCLKFMGILTIVVLVIYLCAGIVAIIRMCLV